MPTLAGTGEPAGKKGLKDTLDMCTALLQTKGKKCQLEDAMNGTCAPQHV